MQHLLWRPVLLSHCQFRCCYGAPLQRSLHSIIHVSAMSILEALLGEAAVMYRSADKIECRPLLKCEQGAGVWGCSVFSEWYGLRELACGCLDFIEGWMSQLGKIICRPPAFVALWRGQCDIIWHIAIVYPVSVLFEEMSGIPILPFWTTFACAVIPAV